MFSIARVEISENRFGHMKTAPLLDKDGVILINLHGVKEYN